MQTWINTFLVVLAAIFPVVNPPGTALVFIGLTSGFTPHIRRTLALRVAINSLLVLVCSFLLGALILQFYGISISVLRAAGGFIVAVSGWNLAGLSTSRRPRGPGRTVDGEAATVPSL